MIGHGETALHPEILFGHGTYVPGVHRATVQIGSPAYVAPLSTPLTFFHFQLVVSRSPRVGLFVCLCPTPLILLPLLLLMPDRAVLLRHLHDP